MHFVGRVVPLGFGNSLAGFVLLIRSAPVSPRPGCGTTEHPLNGTSNQRNSRSTEKRLNCSTAQPINGESTEKRNAHQHLHGKHGSPAGQRYRHGPNHPRPFLKTIDKQGLGDDLFHDWRYDESGEPKPDFILNQSRVTGSERSFSPVTTSVAAARVNTLLGRCWGTAFVRSSARRSPTFSATTA